MFGVKEMSESMPVLFVDKSECCGCSACSDICPMSAIKMLEDNEGFLYPYIENDKCICCNTCVAVCPLK